MSRDPAARPASIEQLLVTDDNVLAIFGPHVLVQSRRGALEPSVLRRAGAFAEPRFAAGTAIGYLAILEPGASLPSAELRKAQRDVIDHWARQSSVRIAVAILGDDTTASLVRSSGRLLAPGSPRVQRFEAVLPAVAWLASELASLGARVNAVALNGAVDAIRHLRPDSPPERR